MRETGRVSRICGESTENAGNADEACAEDASWSSTAQEDNDRLAFRAC